MSDKKESDKHQENSDGSKNNTTDIVKQGDEDRVFSTFDTPDSNDEKTEIGSELGRNDDGQLKTGPDYGPANEQQQGAVAENPQEDQQEPQVVDQSGRHEDQSGEEQQGLGNDYQRMLVQKLGELKIELSQDLNRAIKREGQKMLEEVKKDNQRMFEELRKMLRPQGILSAPPGLASGDVAGASVVPDSRMLSRDPSLDLGYNSIASEQARRLGGAASASLERDEEDDVGRQSANGANRSESPDEDM